MTLLEVDGLSVTYAGADYKALNDASFTLDTGKTVAVVGESGSGKSTLAHVLAGLLDQTAEMTGRSLSLNGENLLTANRSRWRELRRTQLSMVFQSPIESWNPTRTMRAQVMGGLKAAGRPDLYRSLVESVRRVGIDEPEQRLGDYAHQLSGGMLQRISIASAVVNGPSLLIADEPTSALDSTVQAEILQILSELRNDSNLAMVIISHDLTVVNRVADDVLVMYGGKIVESGPTDLVLGDPVHPYTRGLLDSVPRLTDEPRRSLPSMPTGGIPNQGCPFQPRCALAVAACETTSPSLEITGATRVACPPALSIRSSVAAS